MLTSLRGVLIQAKCVKCESTLQAITSVLIFRNSSTRSEKAKISVGHTNVLQMKTRNSLKISKKTRLNHLLTNLMDRRKTLHICRHNQSTKVVWIRHLLLRFPQNVVPALKLCINHHFINKLKNLRIFYWILTDCFGILKLMPFGFRTNWIYVSAGTIRNTRLFFKANANIFARKHTKCNQCQPLEIFVHRFEVFMREKNLKNLHKNMFSVN